MGKQDPSSIIGDKTIEDWEKELADRQSVAEDGFRWPPPCWLWAALVMPRAFNVLYNEQSAIDFHRRHHKNCPVCIKKELATAKPKRKKLSTSKD